MQTQTRRLGNHGTIYNPAHKCEHWNHKIGWCPDYQEPHPDHINTQHTNYTPKHAAPKPHPTTARHAR